MKEKTGEYRIVLKCGSSTDATKLAGSLYSAYRDDLKQAFYIRVIGAGALNQAVKAAIISNKFFSKNGIVVGLQPSFQTSEDGVTVIELKVLFLSL